MFKQNSQVEISTIKYDDYKHEKNRLKELSTHWVNGLNGPNSNENSRQLALQLYQAKGKEYLTQSLAVLTKTCIEKNQSNINKLKAILADRVTWESSNKQLISTVKANIENNILLVKEGNENGKTIINNIENSKQNNSLLQKALEQSITKYKTIFNSFSSIATSKQITKALFKSLSFKHELLISKLFTLNFDPKYKNVYGNTLLHYLCEIEVSDINLYTTILLKEVSVDIRNQYGETPLHLACLYSLEPIVELLIKHNASVNAIATLGKYTVLHEAASGGNIQIIALLLDKGANANFVDIKGNTVLHYAALNGQILAFKLLAKFCTKITSINENNEGIFDLILALEDKVLVSEFTKACKELVKEIKAESILLKKSNEVLQSKLSELEKQINSKSSENIKLKSILYNIKNDNEYLENAIQAKEINIKTLDGYQDYVSTFTKELHTIYLQWIDNPSENQVLRNNSEIKEILHDQEAITLDDLIGCITNLNLTQ